MRFVCARSRRSDTLLARWVLPGLLGLSLLAGAGCSSSSNGQATDTASEAENLSGDARSTPYPLPTMAVLESPPGSTMQRIQITYRSEVGVPISARQPMQLRVVRSIARLPIVGEPTRTYEDGPTPGAQIFIDQATYEISDEDYARLTAATPSAVTVAVHDGRRYWPYPYRLGSTDVRRPVVRPHYNAD